MLDKMKKTTKDIMQYAAPSFPAQDAWKNMEEMLNKEMPRQDKRKKRFILFWLTALLMIGFAGFLILKPSNKNENNLPIIAKNIIKNHKKTDIKNVEKNLQNSSKNMLLNNNKVGAESKETKTLIYNISKLNRTYFIKNKNPKKILKNKTTNQTNEAFKQIATIKKSKEISNNAGEEFYNVSTPKINILKEFYTKINNKKNGINDRDIKAPIDEEINQNLVVNEDKNVIAKELNLTNENTAEIEENKAKTAAVIKVPKSKTSKTLHYGLQWNILLPQANNYLDYNAKSQPLSLIIPEFWVSKNLNAKSEVSLLINPYSQYNLRNNNVLNSKDYVVSILQGSNTTPTTTTYIQTRSLLKAMGVELTAKYAFKISNNFSVALGIGNTWLNAAVVNDKVSNKDGKLSHDSLYGIAKGFNDWDYLKSSFLVSKFEVLYQVKRFQIGVSFIKPIGNIYSYSNTNTNPVNGRAIIRWKIK